MMIIKGNREQIIDLVTRLYNFSLRHSNQNDELIIELNHHKITFSNNNFNYLDDDLKRIDISYRAKLITLAFTIIISLFSY